MRVIPVIDMMHGVVVRGVAGKRDEYRPIESLLAADARPETVGRALAAGGYRDVYVADLDAIAGDIPAWSVYELLQRLGLSLWVDAGVTNVERAREFASFSRDGRPLGAVVAGLESMKGADALEEIASEVGPRRLIFSLDLKSGMPITRAGAFDGMSPLQIARLALRLGVRRMIVLDLAAVGMGQGVPTAPLCRSLRCQDAELEIIAGGGVRGPADLRALEAAGCNAALVASALHDGRIGAGEQVIRGN
jgi:phosphoribosylformimino-5-aminoimidazole carboxamide ribotide isomerase